MEQFLYVVISDIFWTNFSLPVNNSIAGVPNFMITGVCLSSVVP
jgi:hypothetical protein